MEPQQRTPIMTGSWSKCHRCRQPTLDNEMRARQVRSGVTTAHNIIGLRVATFKNYKLVDFCPTCDWQEEVYLRRQGWRKLAITGTVGAGLWGWSYISLTVVVSLLAAGWAVIGLAVFGWRRRKQRQLIIVEKGEGNGQHTD